MLLAPALAAWSAFLLCRHITKSWWPALLGGYIFGFFVYMTARKSIPAHRTAHDAGIPAPLAVLAVTRAIEGRLAAGKLIAWLAAILIAQFLISTEVFATLTMFGAIALFLGWVFAPTEAARRVAKVTLPILCSYTIAVAILSPYIYWLFAFGAPQGEFWPLLMEHYNFGALIFILPADLPIIAIAAAYLWRERRTPAAGILAGSSIIVGVLMVSPRIHILGIPLFTPSSIIMSLPLIDKALPFRFSMYSFLLFGIMTSLWFRSNGWGKAVNAALAAIVVLASIPGLAGPWTFPANCPAFFTSGIYREYLKPGDNVLALPYGYRGDSMLWQAVSGMYFRMAGGWTGAHPAEFDGWPIFNAFYVATYLPDAADQLGAFMAHHEIDAAVVANSDPAARSWDALLSNFASAKYDAAGVTIYRLLPSALKPYGQATAEQMRRQARSVAIDSLLIAAGQWIAAGHPLAQLSPYEAIQHGMLKPAWFVGSTTGVFTDKPIGTPLGSRGFLYSGAGLFGTPNGLAKIVVYGSYADLEPSIARYRNVATHIYFPYPRDLLAPGTSIPPADQWAHMEMEFSPDRIAAIAAQLKPVPPR